MKIKEFPMIVFVTKGEDSNSDDDDFLLAHMSKQEIAIEEGERVRVALYKFVGLQELRRADPIAREIKHSRKAQS